MTKILPLLFALGLALGGCAKNPVTGDADLALMSEKDEVRQGREYHRQIVEQYGVYDDPALQAYVDDLGQRLARVSHRAHLDYTFTVLDSPEINAFALPGGYIYITRGIMAYLDSEAELAGVLGHEIGHVTAKHSLRQQSGKLASDILSVLVTVATGEQGLGELSQTLGTGLVRGYGRDHELEADKLGAEYLHRVGYDPERMLDVIGVLKDQEVYEREKAREEGREANIYHGVFSTHPENDDRLKTVVRAARKLSEKDYRDDNRATYRRMIDGMVWGPSPSQGLIVANRFVFPPLAFALQYPLPWHLHNGSRYLDATDPGSGAIIRLQARQRNEGETPAELLRRLTRRPDLAVEADGELASARIPVTTGDGENQPGRLLVLALDADNALSLLGTAPEESFDRVARITGEVAASLEKLSERELAALPVPRLRIVERRNQTFGGLARDSWLGEDAEGRLRLLNRSYPRGDIGKLDSLKIVEIR